jgi:hypothetical protein
MALMAEKKRKLNFEKIKTKQQKIKNKKKRETYDIQVVQEFVHHFVSNFAKFGFDVC